MVEGFNLDAIREIIRRYGFKHVTLQFPDACVSKCLLIYSSLFESCANDGVEFYIAADSTFGSSVDDISAAHVDSDLLVYFGNDLSSSGAIPVVICWKEEQIDLNAFQVTVNQLPEPPSGFLILYEVGYSNSIPGIVQCFENRFPQARISVAKLPNCANLSNWQIEDEERPIVGINQLESIGGLIVESQTLQDQDWSLIYIGSKTEQLTSICLRASNKTVIAYDPTTKSSASINGSQTREFRERTGGMLRVEKSRIIGLIVGSMGLTEGTTQAIVSRLQTLVEAAGKRHYTFLMGRLNEAKLANFPEVDLFCLIGNTDSCVINAKCFHVPVITPWELELGLGARPWNSVFQCDAAAILSGDESLAEAIFAVKTTGQEREEDQEEVDFEDPNGDSSNRFNNNLRGSKIINLNVEMKPELDENKMVSFYSSGVWRTGTDSEESQLTVFESAASDFFQSRNFQGLDPNVPEQETADISIKMGQFGTASSYAKMD